MASSFFALFDDIAVLLDDVAVMTKVAAKKTAGVLGDDLALNAQQVSGVAASRELPVVWAVAKGSMLNKVILVPTALLISAIAPWAVTPLLMVGGAYLCFEGAEKVLHAWWHKDDQTAHLSGLKTILENPSPEALMDFEKTKIKGAIRTDFILSAEIIVIALGTAAAASLTQRVAVLVSIAVLMTVGVYGLVAAIVKLDDLGLWLQQRRTQIARLFGSILISLAPKLMRLLSFLGTAAMFLVGGSIVLHGLPALHHATSAWRIPDTFAELLLGVVCGLLLCGLWWALGKIKLFATSPAT